MNFPLSENGCTPLLTFHKQISCLSLYCGQVPYDGQIYRVVGM